MSKTLMGYGARLVVDDHHGVYSAMEACRIARELGWDGRQPTDIEDSWYQEQVATDWLNENVATVTTTHSAGMRAHTSTCHRHGGRMSPDRGITGYGSWCSHST